MTPGHACPIDARIQILKYVAKSPEPESAGNNATNPANQSPMGVISGTIRL